MRILITFLILLQSTLLSADGGISKLRNDAESTIVEVKCDACVSLINSYKRSNHDSAKYFVMQAIKYCEEANNINQLAMTHKLEGVSYFFQSDYDHTLEAFNKALGVYIDIKDTASIGGMYNNIGRVFIAQGNFLMAIDNYLKALEILESMDNVEDKLAGTLINMGNIQKNTGQYEKAIVSYKRAIELADVIDDKNRKAKALGNVANCYKEMGQMSNAKKHAHETLIVAEEIHKFNSIYTNALSVIGEIALIEKDYELAKAYFEKALKIQDDNNDQSGIASNKTALGNLMVATGKYDEAILFCSDAYQISEEIGSISKKQIACQCLADAYDLKGNRDKAYIYFKQYINLKDSIFDENKAAAITQKTLQFDFEKKEAVVQMEHEKQQMLKEQEAVRSKIVSVFIGLGLLLVGGFAFVINKRLKITRKQKTLIEKQKKEVEQQKFLVDNKNVELAHQKELIEEKSQEISDSIDYAQRIQRAILPPDTMMSKCLKNGFVLFKPKDVVSGDFYWMELVAPTGNNKESILFAAADCTGHGVPGAMVSVVCHGALNRAVREFQLVEPAKILNKVRELVIETFERSEEEVKDGMDISLCSLTFNNEGATLEWAGANNPLYLITSNKEKASSLASGKDLIEMDNVNLACINPDKQPIGKYAAQSPFTNRKIKLEKGETIYVFTDGFADQFGGPKEKKFMYKPFKRLLVSVNDKTADNQKEIIDRAFENWRGDQEQVDDVCIIGIQI